MKVSKTTAIVIAMLICTSIAWGQGRKSNRKTEDREFDLQYSETFNIKKHGIPVRFEGINSQYFAMVMRDKKVGDKVKGYDYVCFFDKRTFDKTDAKPIYFYGPKRPMKNKTKGISLNVDRCIMLENSFAVIYDEAKKAKKDRRGLKTKHRFFADIYNMDGQLISSGKSLPNNINRFIAFPKSGFIIAAEKEIARENQSKKDFQESKPTFRVHILDTSFNSIYSNTFKINEMRKYVSIMDIEPIRGDTPAVAVSVGVYKNDGKKEERKNREMIVLFDQNEEKMVELPFVQYKNLTLEPDNFIFDPGITHDNIHGLSFVSATKVEQGKSVAKKTNKALKGIRDNFYAIYYSWNPTDDSIGGEANIHPIYTNPINYNFELTKKQEKYERKVESREEKAKKKANYEYFNQGSLSLAAILQAPSGNYYRFLERRYRYEVCETMQQGPMVTRRCYWVYVFKDVYILETDKNGKAIQAFKYPNTYETTLGFDYGPVSFTPVITEKGRPAIIINRASSGATSYMELIEFNEKTTEAFYMGIQDKTYRMPQVNWFQSKNYDRTEGRLYFVKPGKKKTYRLGSI